MIPQTFEDITYYLQRSPRRRTIGLTVERDGQIIVTAPLDCELPQVEAALNKRRNWLYTRLVEKDRLLGHPPHRSMVNGQGFLYLGRSYRLRIVPDAESPGVPLRLFQSRFELRQSDVGRGHVHFIDWYTKRALQVVPERVAMYQNRLQVKPTSLHVIDLGYRWGSCSADGALNFHWRIILAPLRIVDYAVVHEMLHLQSGRHGEDFTRRLRRVMPDYVARQQWLAEYGAELGV